jgi:hypothetical protein
MFVRMHRLPHSSPLTPRSCLSPPRKQWKDSDAARVALRTVRHSLQRHGASISRVVFCLSAGVEEAAYAEAAALYFPRNEDEQSTSQAATAHEQLDEFGDLVQGRGVSIGRKPSDTAALADARGSAGDGAADQAGDWSQTLLRCGIARFVVFSLLVTSCARSHARC